MSLNHHYDSMITEDELEFSIGRNIRNVEFKDDSTTTKKRIKIKKLKTTSAPTTTIATTTIPEEDEDEESDEENTLGEDNSDEDYRIIETNEEEDSDDHDKIEDPLKQGYWDVKCQNRAYDENFKTINTKINANFSTIHIPVNVFKQSMEINMTAFWSEELNSQFIKNYEKDNELSWQYFCSASGLFRQYPASYWTAPQLEDFFDCRLQSWYIMAAASSKDMLILLDSSGSMTGLRLEIATKLIESILDTLTDNDFFNVITFATSVILILD